MNVVEVADKIVDQAIGYGFVGTAAQIKNAINDAVAEERERCAKIAERWAEAAPMHKLTADRIADEIRSSLAGTVKGGK